MLGASSRPFPGAASDIRPNWNIPPYLAFCYRWSKSLISLDCSGSTCVPIKHGVRWATKRTECVKKPALHPSGGPPLRGLAAIHDQGLIPKVGLGKTQPLRRAGTCIDGLARETDTEKPLSRNGHLGTDSWELNARQAHISISKTPSSMRAGSSSISKKTDTPKHANAINSRSQAASSRGMVITRQRILRCWLQYFPHPARHWLLHCIDNSLPETAALLRECK